MTPNAFANAMIPQNLLKQGGVGWTALRNLKSEVYKKRNLCK